MNSNQMRSYLRKQCAAGLVEARTTYYDYYDSCHPPTVTPDAPWIKATYREQCFSTGTDTGYIVYKRDLMKTDHCPSVRQLDDNTFELSTGYKTWQLRVVKG